MTWRQNVKSRFQQVQRASSGVVTFDRFKHAFNDNRLFLLLIVSVLFLTAAGFILVYSAMIVRWLVRGSALWMEALRFFGLSAMGVAIFFIVSKLSMRLLERSTIALYLLFWSAQVLTFFIGKESGGNRNWLQVGPLTIQPSEFLKLGFVMLLALILARIPTEVRRGIGAVVYLTGALAVTILPVLLCRDMGSAVIFVLIYVVVLAVAQVSGWYLTGFLGLAAVGAAGLVVISPSRRTRVASTVRGLLETLHLVSPEPGYQPPSQVDHARWAIGIGGLLGQGPGSSREKWMRLPTADSDFIFAILGEEYGYVGAIVVIAMFALLVAVLLSIAIRTEHPWAKLVCVGTAAWIGLQAIVNIIVVLGYFPTLGVPLPFLSRGFSSLWSLLGATGIALASARQLPGVKSATRAKRGRFGSVKSILGRR